jgi:hypothetical protein
MIGGTIVDRQWVVILSTGEVVIDWGDGLYQNIDDGSFHHYDESLISRPAPDDVLTRLKLNGKVGDYNSHLVSILGVPPRNQKSLD